MFFTVNMARSNNIYIYTHTHTHTHTHFNQFYFEFGGKQKAHGSNLAENRKHRAFSNYGGNETGGGLNISRSGGKLRTAPERLSRSGL